MTPRQPNQDGRAVADSKILELTAELTRMIREAERTNRELKEAQEKIEKLARTDPLTDLANRRTLLESMQREIARAQRLGENLSIVLCDLDFFKSINDQHGHIAGDHVLEGVAAVLRSQSRLYDLAARYGGEEFVILLPATPTKGAIAVAQRLRQKIAEIKLPDCPEEITASFGIATWIAGESPDQLIARADAALYAAKGAGRNRVEVALGMPA